MTRVRTRRRRAAPMVVDLASVDLRAIADVGGKNASLGEMIRKLGRRGISVPGGFALTAQAYWAFIDHNALREPIAQTLASFKRGRLSLRRAGARIRGLVSRAAIPPPLSEAIGRAYADMARTQGWRSPAVAVRSSATAEDLPDMSFAGQHESYLNIRGFDAVLKACRDCIASLFTDRAIAYRERNGIDHMRVALSVGVQRMVRSDVACSGVMFTLDPETGFPGVVRIEAVWGLGELIVKGLVNPDSFTVFKPPLARRGVVPIIEKTLGRKELRLIRGAGAKLTRRQRVPRALAGRFTLSDDDTLLLARWAVEIEALYGRPMDIEWAKDGDDGRFYIVQARPETVQSRKDPRRQAHYRLKHAGRRLLTGIAVGDSIAAGKVCKLRSPSQTARFRDGAVLVAQNTDPDWVPIMRRAAAVVTEQGGRTSHAAIVSREFGLPAVVSAPGAMSALRDGQDITVSCAEGEQGRVYDGTADFTVTRASSRAPARTRTHVMVNVADPAAALRWWTLPCDGVGLARMEFIITDHIKIHPLALARYRTLKDRKARREIARLTAGYKDKGAYFVDRLSRGVAAIAAAFHPRPVIVRMSDFKTNEYAALIGGKEFEPEEENPMIGWRGASRYYDDAYRDGFALECAAIGRARDLIGLDNIVVMIPFCRTLREADLVLKEMARHGLKRGRNGLEVYVMCEIPANVVLADAFFDRFDGFSIGSNDLTQLTLGVDRDSRKLAPLFKESDPAVTAMIRQAIGVARRRGKKIGLCGQAPSDNPRYARFLVEAGISSISVTPDRVEAVRRNVAAAERRR